MNDNDNNTDNNIPLCIKLNYTLISSNIIFETIIQTLNHNPLLLFCFPF